MDDKLAIKELTDALTSLFNAVWDDHQMYLTYNALSHPDIEQITQYSKLPDFLRRSMNSAYYTIHKYSGK